MWLQFYPSCQNTVWPLIQIQEYAWLRAMCRTYKEAMAATGEAMVVVVCCGCSMIGDALGQRQSHDYVPITVMTEDCSWKEGQAVR